MGDSAGQLSSAFYGGNSSAIVLRSVRVFDVQHCAMHIRTSGAFRNRAIRRLVQGWQPEMVESSGAMLRKSSVDIMPVSIHNLVVDLHSLSLDTTALTSLAKEWRISRLSAFGSVVRDDFRNDSDVDLLVEFEPNVQYSLIDLATLKAQLEQIFRRDVDVVEPAALTNPYRRRHILETAQLLYAA